MKECRKCQKIKKDDDFNACSSSKDGLAGWCKQCKKNWTNANPEKIKAIKKRQYEKLIERFSKFGLGVGTVKRYGFELSEKIYNKFNRKCVNCDSAEDLTFHHIDHKGRNYTNAGLDPNNNEDNLILICRSCHGKLHGRPNKKEREL